MGRGLLVLCLKLKARRYGTSHRRARFINKPHYWRKLILVGLKPRRDHPMEFEGTKEMVLQALVGLLSMGLAVLTIMLMGRWV
jgi:hypothetical protein